jgi:hypothetical protein
MGMREQKRGGIFDESWTGADWPEWAGAIEDGSREISY